MENIEIKTCLASRKRARTVNIFSVVSETVREASRTGFGAKVEHGGGVPNCYDYPADSECVGAVAVRTSGRGGVAYCRYACIPANKITASGAANATLGVRGPWDRRRTSAAADYDFLREDCWKNGDIIWRETALGGLYYRAGGYGWRAVNTSRQPITGQPLKRAVRAMRRLCPAGWSVVVTPASHEAKPAPGWMAAGETYLIASTPAGRYDVRGTIRAAQNAFAARAAQREKAVL